MRFRTDREQHPDYYTTHQLNSKGWTRELIADALGEPDIPGKSGIPTSTPNMWLRSRVTQVLRDRPDVQAKIEQRHEKIYPLQERLSDRYGFDVALAVADAIRDGLMTEAEAVTMVEYRARQGRWAW